MKRIILVIEHILLWLLVWFVISSLMYFVQVIAGFTIHLTFYECIFDKFTLLSQFCLGWMIPLVFLEEKRRNYLV